MGALNTSLVRFQEDLLIYEHFFKKQENEEPLRGYFLKMGAYDGLMETNTRFFESCLGWTGLLIETSPPSFEKLKTNGATHRLNSDLLNVAPSCLEFSNVDMPSFSNTGVSMHESVDWMGKDQIRRVQCGPLSYYLEQLGVTKIDFWSLDVEAYEWHVLRTFDFEKVEIGVSVYLCKYACGDVTHPAAVVDF